MARYQTQGKGQRGSSWFSNPGETLTISFVLYPEKTSIRQAFNLNMLICLGIQQWIAQWLPHATVKWPNDIYINDRKIGGVLIENQLAGTQIRSSIVGIGINMKQTSFPEGIRDSATSLCIEHPAHRPTALEDYGLSLLETILRTYQQTDLQNTQNLLHGYEQRLYRKDIPAYYDIAGKTCLGIIRGVSQDGRLEVLIEGQKRLFDLKEIRFVR